MEGVSPSMRNRHLGNADISPLWSQTNLDDFELSIHDPPMSPLYRSY